MNFYKKIIYCQALSDKLRTTNILTYKLHIIKIYWFYSKSYIHVFLISMNTINAAKIQPTFKSWGNENIRFMNYDEYISNCPSDEDFLFEEEKKDYNNNYWKEQFEINQRISERFRKEEEEEFLRCVKPEIKNSVKNMLALPTYDLFTLPYLIDLKSSEINHIHSLASQKDILGEMRIPAETLPFFSGMEEERLKMFEPLMLSKNDAGMWNYVASHIIDLDKHYDNKQIYIMSKLAQAKVHGSNLESIASNPYLNHKKTIEKAEMLNKLYGKDLREISFFPNSKNENWLSADIQLPHRDDKPDWQNFKRVYARLDDDVNPINSNEEMKEVNKYVDDMYYNFEKKLHVFSESELNSAINDVSAKNPDATEFEILRTMQKLTQFSNYNSLKNINEVLLDKNINRINPKGGINPIFSYISSKHLVDLSKQDGGINFGIFITKDDLNNNYFNEICKQAKDLPKDSTTKVKFINLEGWDDGINLITDEKTLAKRTDIVIKQAKKIQKENSDYTFNDSLSEVLNKDIESKLSKDNLECITVSIDAPATRGVILDQMRPIMPTKSILKSTILSVSDYYTKEKKVPKKYPEMCMKIAKYYDDNINIFSKQRIIEDLKTIHENINDYLKKNNLDENNVTLIIPKTPDTKSFELINKMYQKMYKTPIKKISDVRDLNMEPENSVFIILDDVIGSGSSMMNVGFYWEESGKLNRDKHILFCPITATEEGVETLNNVINKNGRNNSDKIINLKQNTMEYSKIASDFINDGNIELNEKVFTPKGHGNFGMCTVFPYMAPDNCSGLSSHLLKYFVPNSDCIKNKGEFFDEIEESTMYYDIFGTDKNHIITNHKIVFSRQYESLVHKIFGKIFD